MKIDWRRVPRWFWQEKVGERWKRFNGWLMDNVLYPAVIVAVFLLSIAIAVVLGSVCQLGVQR